MKNDLHGLIDDITVEALIGAINDVPDSVHELDEKGRTPLLVAARKRRADVADVLLKRGAIVDAKDCYGWTALQYAVDRGDIAVVELLLDAGADPNHKNDNGFTALHYAAFTAPQCIVESLIQAGADPCIKDRRGRRPIDLVARDRQGVRDLLLTASELLRLGPGELDDG